MIRRGWVHEEFKLGATGDRKRMLHNAQVLHAGSQMLGLDGRNQGF